MGENLFPDSFQKKKKLSISPDQQAKVLYSLFLLYAKLRAILKLSCRPLAFASYKAFIKNKRRSATSLSASFPAGFLKKNICLVIFYYQTKFQRLVAFT